MPPCTQNFIFFIRPLFYQIKRHFSQLLPPTVPTTSATYPFQNLLYLLQKCQNQNQFNQIHAQMILTGLIHDPHACSKLVASLASRALPGATTCTALLIADQHGGLDTYTWNTVMRGYLEEDKPKEALSTYAHIRNKGLKIDSYTIVFAAKACGLVPAVLEGEELHAQVFKLGFTSEMIITTSLLQMYGLFDKLESAQQMFDESSARDIVLWNALIALYAQRNSPNVAILVSRSMIEESVRPNGETLVSILSACSCLRALKEGKQIHGYAVKNLAIFDVFVYNALIDMYSKCGSLVSAHEIFQRMPNRNVISWTTMINGYSQNNYPNEALALFKEMESANMEPDEVTILGIISMCSKLGSFELGAWIDHYVERNGHNKKSVHVENALMDMHAKCGNIKKACQIFYQIEKKTLVSWTTMIQGLAMHGHEVAALTLFCQMQREGFRPDEILFLCILSACNHSGLVHEGLKCFQSMMEDYHIRPSMEHYGCMVDLLCRAGKVNEAFEFVEKIPVKPDVIIWRMLIGASRNHGNNILASKVMNHLLSVEPEYSGNYVLISNLHANMGEWNSVEEIRAEMGVKGVAKEDPGCSFIETSCTV